MSSFYARHLGNHYLGVVLIVQDKYYPQVVPRNHYFRFRFTFQSAQHRQLECMHSVHHDSFLPTSFGLIILRDLGTLTDGCVMILICIFVWRLQSCN